MIKSMLALIAVLAMGLVVCDSSLINTCNMGTGTKARTPAAEIVNVMATCHPAIFPPPAQIDAMEQMQMRLEAARADFMGIIFCATTASNATDEKQGRGSVGRHSRDGPNLALPDNPFWANTSTTQRGGRYSGATSS
jgi:hypothetical protein